MWKKAKTETCTTYGVDCGVFFSKDSYITTCLIATIKLKGLILSINKNISYVNFCQFTTDDWATTTAWWCLQSKSLKLSFGRVQIDISTALLTNSIATTYILNFMHHLAAILWWSWVNENDSWLSSVKLTHACMWGVWNWWWPKQYWTSHAVVYNTLYRLLSHIV